MQGKLVHHQTAYVARLETTYFSFQVALVERLKGVPVQASEATDVADWQQLQQAFEPDPQTLGQAGCRLQSVDPLGYTPAAQTVHAAHRQLQQDSLIQQVTVTHLMDAPLVDQRAGFGTPAANRYAPGLRLKTD